MNCQHGASVRIRLSSPGERPRWAHRSNVAAVLIVLAGLGLVAQTQMGTPTISVSFQLHGLLGAGSHMGSGASGSLPLPWRNVAPGDSFELIPINNGLYLLGSGVDRVSGAVMHTQQYAAGIGETLLYMTAEHSVRPHAQVALSVAVTLAYAIQSMVGTDGRF